MKDLFSVAGKVTLITGGSSGIGAMFAEGFVKNGAKVYICSRKAQQCGEVVEELKDHGQIDMIPADLSTLEGIDMLKNTLAEREDHLDVLINNAGAAWGMPFEEYTEDGWDKVMTLNTKSPFFLTQRCYDMLKKSDAGRVINVASINGLRVPSLETYAYSTSKAGCVMLTKHLAWRFAADKINVNAICPGPFPSKMMRATLEAAKDQILERVPLKRVGEPEDMAGIAMFLASAASSYITGEAIAVDGGATYAQPGG